MGMEELGNGPASGKTKSGKRGSVRNAERLAIFKDGGATAGADWGACDPRWLQAVIVMATSLGGAIMFGTSRDGGAYSLVLYLDGEKASLWFNGGADLDAELEAVHARLETLRG